MLTILNMFKCTPRPNIHYRDEYLWQLLIQTVYGHLVYKVVGRYYDILLVDSVYES